MTPEKAARAILRGVKRGEYLVFTSNDTRVAHWFQRKFGFIYERAMRRLNDWLYALAKPLPATRGHGGTSRNRARAWRPPFSLEYSSKPSNDEHHGLQTPRVPPLDPLRAHRGDARGARPSHDVRAAPQHLHDARSPPAAHEELARVRELHPGLVDAPAARPRARHPAHGLPLQERIRVGPARAHREDGGHHGRRASSNRPRPDAPGGIRRTRCCSVPRTSSTTITRSATPPGKRSAKSSI